MVEIKISCPHCGQNIQCDESYSGREIECPNCKQLMQIEAEGHHEAEPSLNPNSNGSTAFLALLFLVLPVLASLLLVMLEIEFTSAILSVIFLSIAISIILFVKCRLIGFEPSSQGNNPGKEQQTQQDEAGQGSPNFCDECPQCSSPDVQSAAMGFMAGASRISGIGVGATNKGGLGVGTFGGTQQTLLADYLAPPSKRMTIGVVLITWFIATIGLGIYSAVRSGGSPESVGEAFLAPFVIPFLYGSFDAHDKMLFHILVTAPTVIAIFIALSNSVWNDKEHSKLMEKYSKTWYCRKCGFAWLV